MRSGNAKRPRSADVLQNLGDRTDVVLGQFRRALGRINARPGADVGSAGRPDAVDVPQGDIDALVVGMSTPRILGMVHLSLPYRGSSALGAAQARPTVPPPGLPRRISPGAVCDAGSCR